MAAEEGECGGWKWRRRRGMGVGGGGGGTATDGAGVAGGWAESITGRAPKRRRIAIDNVLCT